MKLILTIILIIYALLPAVGKGQVLDGSRCADMVLRDGIQVRVCADVANKHAFYYLPVTIQLAASNGTPQISLLVYKERGSELVSGGILHFLFQWGLSESQEQDLGQKLITGFDSSAFISGPADITLDAQEQINIRPDSHPIAEILSRSISQPFRVPPTASGKSAASAKLSAEDAVQVWKAFTQPASVKPFSIYCNYTYPVVTRDGIVRTVVQKQGTMCAKFNNWINQAIKFNNAKIAEQ